MNARDVILVVSVVLAFASSTAQAADCPNLRRVTTSFMHSIIWPASRDAVLSGKTPAELSQNATGRVIPVGTFDGAFGAMEYFFALAGPLDPNNPSPESDRVTDVNFRYLTCDSQTGQTAFSALVTFSKGNGDLSLVADLTGLFTFTKANKICSYDLAIRRLDQARTFAALAEAGVPENAPAAVLPIIAQATRAGLLESICQVAIFKCGNLYANVEDCKFQLKDKPTGTWDQADQDTLTCRVIHSLLVTVRPEVHCKHISVGGGGKCVFHPYNNLITQSFSTCSN